MTEAPVSDFLGHDERECGEHRTTGARAWCFDCSEWCYPNLPCKGCGVPMLETLVRQAVAALGTAGGYLKRFHHDVAASDALGWRDRIKATAESMGVM